MRSAKARTRAERPVTRSSRPRQLVELINGNAEVQQVRGYSTQAKRITSFHGPNKKVIGRAKGTQKKSAQLPRAGRDEQNQNELGTKPIRATNERHRNVKDTSSSRQKGSKVDERTQRRPSRVQPATQASTISNWAQNVRPGKPPHLPERQPSETPDIRSSSSETESLIMTEGTGKTLKTLRQSLENRQIHLEESNERDERLKELQNNLKAELNPRPDRSQVQFLQILKSEIFETLNEFDKQSYSVLDTLLMQLDQNKNEIRYPFTHPTYFESQLEKCASRSEHVLQRTIMMNIFHPYWLPKIFEWNVEGLWQFDPYASLFGASDSEKLARPKPDLSFGFARGAFISITKFNVTVPEDLRVAISPDDSRQQYFPFLFVEVKKGGLGLEEAKLKNLRTAARALYNIHRWFEQAKHHKGTQNEEIEWDKSFQKIRIFTFAFNASELVVRIHRAETLAPGKSGRSAKLIFSFADFFTLSRGYTRDEICGLFNNIMSDYAATELLPSLQAVYRAVLDVAVQTLIDTPEQQMRRSDSDDAGVDRQVDEGSNDGDDDEEQHGYMASQQQGHFSQEPQEPQLTQNLQTSQAMQDSQPRRKRPGSKGRGASKRKKG